MSSHGSFYLYLRLDEKTKVLVYTYYCHSDGFANVNKVADYYRNLQLKYNGPTTEASSDMPTVVDIVNAMTKAFGCKDNFLAEDAEYVLHAELHVTTCQQPPATLFQAPCFRFVKKGYAAHCGYWKSWLGNCYIINSKTSPEIEYIYKLPVSMGSPYKSQLRT